MRQFKRADRLSEQILRDISRLVENELSVQPPGMVTFTHVSLSNDLFYATVFYSVLGSEENLESVKDYFENNKKQIRQLLGSKLNTRRVPELSFKYDSSIEYGLKIEKLLNEIKSDTKNK